MKLLSKFKIRKLEKSIKRYPHIAENYFELARSYRDAENYEEAASTIRDFLEANPESEERNRGLFLLADTAYRSGNHDEAWQWLSKIEGLQNSELQSEISYLKGSLLYLNAESEPEKTDAAIEELKAGAAGIKDAERRTVANDRLATLYEKKGDWGNAVKHWEAKIELMGKQSEKSRERTAALMKAAETSEKKLNDSVKAARYYEKILQEGDIPLDETIYIYLRLADISKRDEDPISAVEKYETALRYIGREDSERAAETMVKLSELYRETGRDEQAKQELGRAMKLKEVPSGLRYRILKDLAEQDREREQHEAALALERQAEQYGDEAQKKETRYRQGEDLMNLGRRDEALELIEPALHDEGASEEMSVEAYYKMKALAARIYFSRGNIAAAATYASEAAEEENVPDLYWILAETAYDDDRIIESLRYYLRICDEFRGSPERSEAMKKLKRIRERFSSEEERSKASLSRKEMQELDRILETVGEETDLIRRLRKGLTKTQMGLVGGIENLLRGRSDIDEDVLDELEELLILSDMGVETTQSIMDPIREGLERGEIKGPQSVRDQIRSNLQEILSDHTAQINIDAHKPFVIMMVGVNGVGKTTTIAKLARKFKDEGKSVLLAAADTFRAGAIEQLTEWGNRLELDVVKQKAGTDPSAVAYDAVQAAVSRDMDCLIIDTAGRLHTKVNLMEELKKIRRVISKNLDGAPHEILLVVDATTGQNAVNQAQIFKEAVDVSGLILTKLDGTAKGGIIVRIANEYNIPIEFIGIGEKMDDLRQFKADEFVKALFD